MSPVLRPPNSRVRAEATCHGRKRKVLLIALLIVPAVSALPLAGEGTTCRLSRTTVLPASEEWFLHRLEPSPATTKEELIWAAEARGQRLTIKVRHPGVSLLAPMEIGIEGRDPVSVTGAMAFGENKEILSFGPVRLDLDAGPLSLVARLERYRHVKKENKSDPTQVRSVNEWGMPSSTGRAPGIEYVPYVSGWDLYLGNVEAFAGEFQHRRGRPCKLWLIDADLNGVFGDFGKGGDLLAWQYGSGGGYLGLGGLRRGASPLAPRVRIGDREYAVSLQTDGSDVMLLELSD